MDSFDDVFGLEGNEIRERKRVSTELLRDLIWKEKMLQQKSKARWIKDEDMNSKYFHYWINRRVKINQIEGLWAGEN